MNKRKKRRSKTDKYKKRLWNGKMGWTYSLSLGFFFVRSLYFSLLAVLDHCLWYEWSFSFSFLFVSDIFLFFFCFQNSSALSSCCTEKLHHIKMTCTGYSSSAPPSIFEPCPIEIPKKIYMDEIQFYTRTIYMETSWWYSFFFNSKTNFSVFFFLIRFIFWRDSLHFILLI